MRNRKFKGALKTCITVEQWVALEQADRLKYKPSTDGKVFNLSLTLTRGLLKAYQKAEKFILMLNCKLSTRHYLMLDGSPYDLESKPFRLTTDRNEAKKFALGFDDPTVQANKYSSMTGLNLIAEQMGVKLVKGRDNPSLLTPEQMKEHTYLKGKVKRVSKRKKKVIPPPVKKKRSIPRKTTNDLQDVYIESNATEADIY